MDPVLVKILQEATNNPQYQAIANYLMARRSMPDFNLGYMPGYMGKFISPGLFTSGTVPERGIVSINEGAKQWDPKAMASTATHEMTHAAEKQLIKQYYEIKKKTGKTELEKQFLDNFQKIIGSSEPQISNWIKQVAPDFANKESGYRSTAKEGLSFGVENSSFQTPDEGRNAPPHVDPTIATVFNLLLDQAQRVQDEQKQSQGR